MAHITSLLWLWLIYVSVLPYQAMEKLRRNSGRAKTGCLFNMFSVVNFPNAECTGKSTTLDLYHQPLISWLRLQYTSAGTCTYTLTKSGSDICRIRLDLVKPPLHHLILKVLLQLTTSQEPRSLALLFHQYVGRILDITYIWMPEQTPRHRPPSQQS